jgi:long-chain acyl-CoA synthetase
MLYPLWIETCRRTPARPAVFDGATQATVTFQDLADGLALRPRASAPVIARGGSLSFFLDVLQAWRDGVPVVPLERDAPEPSLPAEIPAGTALVKFSPGAAGIPRAVFFSAVALAADAARIVEAMDLRTSCTNVAAISLAHSYGFSNVVLPLLLHGVPVHALPVPFPHILEEACAAHDTVIVPAVPSMWRAWHRAGVLGGIRIANAISAGAPLALDLEQGVFSSAGLKIHNFYGASECGGISLDTRHTPRTDAGDVGTPLPGVSVSPHESGRLLVRSDSTAIAYDHYREGDILGQGCYLTRDLGYLENNRIHITGHVGGSINVAGRKISPWRVEQALLATGLASRVRVFGIPSHDPERVEEIAGIVDLAPGATLPGLKQAALTQLAGWELPRHWRVQPEPSLWSLDLPALRRVFSTPDHSPQPPG